MKILFITQYYLPQNHGGTELYIYNLCRHLKQLGVASAVCCSAPVLQKGSYLHEGIRVYSSNSIGELVDQLFELVQNEGYTVLHIHTMGGNLSNMLLDRLEVIAVPVFFTPHLVDNFCLNQGKLLYKNSSPCNGFVSRIKCQSCISAIYPGIPFFYQTRLFQFMLQVMLNAGTAEKWLTSFHFLAREMVNRIRVIKRIGVQIIPVAAWYESVLDVNELSHVPFVPQAVSDAFLGERATAVQLGFKWVFAGRLSVEKGIVELVEVFHENALPGDQLILFLFISKEASKFEQEMLASLQHQSNIVIYTNKKAPEVAAIMKNCDCLVLPTKICEMAPLVITEAFSLHLPVLVSDFIKESIAVEQGIKFSYDQPGDFSDKFNHMRLQSRGMKATGFTAYEPKSFLSVAHKHLQLYKTALAT